MPATYAHFKLGRELKPTLQGAVRRAVDAFPQLYDIGLHGPDILFYHRPLKKTGLNGMATQLHEQSGRAFFTHAAGVIRQSRSQRAALAYAAGCLCHFAMDVTCHGYVEEMHARGPASHTAIESDFDRELLVRDGKAPFRYRMAAHIRASRENAGVITPFYAGTADRELLQALRDMKRYSGLLHPRLVLQRKATRKVLAATAPQFGEMILPERPDPRCRETTRRLLELYPQCLRNSKRLVENYTDFLREKAPLEELFRWNFNGRLNEREEIEK